jgi:hypothetical protein
LRSENGLAQQGKSTPRKLAAIENGAELRSVRDHEVLWLVLSRYTPVVHLVERWKTRL